MLAAAVAGVALSAQSGFGASFPEVWDRWKQIDAVWALPETKARRAAALPHLKVASTLVLTARWSDACRHLDQALADLQGMRPSAEYAVTLRFRPPVAEPGKTALLVVGWAYRPADLSPLTLRIANRQVTVTPGRSLTLQVQPARVEPELVRNPELGVPVPAQVGSLARTVYLSILKSARQRIEALLGSSNEAVRALGQKALALLEANVSADPGSSIMGAVLLGESLSRGDQKLGDLDTVPAARFGATPIYATFPKGQTRKTAPVVIALSALGGEAAFATQFGRGGYIESAHQRGWGFVGASATPSAVDDVLEWLKTLGRTPGRYYVVGYGRAAQAASAAGSLDRKAAAIALLAPLAEAVPIAWLQGPLFVAVGAEDTIRPSSSLQGLLRELGGRRDVRIEELEGVEHLMLPAEALGQTYAFFDQFSAKTQS